MWRFKQLYLVNISEVDTRSYELFYLTMTDNITSQNTDLSFWITLCIYCGWGEVNPYIVHAHEYIYSIIVRERNSLKTKIRDVCLKINFLP